MKRAAEQTASARARRAEVAPASHQLLLTYDRRLSPYLPRLDADDRHRRAVTEFGSIAKMR